MNPFVAVTALASGGGVLSGIFNMVGTIVQAKEQTKQVEARAEADVEIAKEQTEASENFAEADVLVAQEATKQAAIYAEADAEVEAEIEEGMEEDQEAVA